MEFKKFAKLMGDDFINEAPEDKFNLDIELEDEDDLNIDDDLGMDDVDDIDIDIESDEEDPELDTDLEDEEPTPVPQGSFSERLQSLGKGWTFHVDFDGDADTQKWEMVLKGKKDERVYSSGPTWGKTLGVLIASARNKGINI